MSNDTTLLGEGAVYVKNHFTCVYCGFDGRPFEYWMQLSIDHIRPKSCGGSDEIDNLVVACRACNAITSKMEFDADRSREQILREKQERIRKRRTEYYDHWTKLVAPRYLDRPLPKL